MHGTNEWIDDDDDDDGCYDDDNNNNNQVEYLYNMGIRF